MLSQTYFEIDSKSPQKWNQLFLDILILEQYLILQKSSIEYTTHCYHLQVWAFNIFFHLNQLYSDPQILLNIIVCGKWSSFIFWSVKDKHFPSPLSCVRKYLWDIIINTFHYMFLIWSISKFTGRVWFSFLNLTLLNISLPITIKLQQLTFCVQELAIVHTKSQ